MFPILIILGVGVAVVVHSIFDRPGRSSKEPPLFDQTHSESERKKLGLTRYQVRLVHDSLDDLVEATDSLEEAQLQAKKLLSNLLSRGDANQKVYIFDIESGKTIAEESTDLK